MGFSLSVGAGLAVGISGSFAFTFELGYRMTFASAGGIDGRWGYLVPQLGIQTTF